MLKRVVGLILLLTAINGFSQQTFKPDSISNELIMDSDSRIDSSAAHTSESEFLEQPKTAFVLLDTAVPPATTMRLSWQPNQSSDGLSTPTPIFVVNGAQEGPVLCLTAAIHGDELNGIEIVRRVLYGTDPKLLSGTIIGVPIVNLQGFQRSSRYLTDRRDLNRFFPGNPHGSSAARIAYSFFKEIISHCNFLVDLHTGSAHRTNLPQVRANLLQPGVGEFAQSFGISVILHSEGSIGMLRHAAVDIGIPSVTLEAGKSMTLQEPAVRYGVKSIQTLLDRMNMLETAQPLETPDSIYYHSAWVRVNHGGILLGNVNLGDKINKNDILGIVTDPITNMRSEIISPYNGRIIGMAIDQVVMPGFAGFHIGIQESEERTARIISIPSKKQIVQHLSTVPESE
ncbi:MAG: succinylglutamate desuccinylase/aspartoacylase family protein [Nitrosomonas sp.]|uniref:succinylglutamate desuccinylase/aspartoacylase family protein n=1 Tax=Nitrosomonas sp. TaxID=42353 RepID=UPI0025D13030|nr:succinylglutamate desuccinylase/aspartoacylase family protein [Nitrosomonas sp.]MBY0474148.1 succinylglutamate desuccinylase/aspartoacylase family protein [Nitrosomonas sp.]